MIINSELTSKNNSLNEQLALTQKREKSAIEKQIQLKLHNEALIKHKRRPKAEKENRRDNRGYTQGSYTSSE